MRDTTEALWIGGILGFMLSNIIWIPAYHYSQYTPDELSCREGKLFEVTHEGNITIYDPTFDECEEGK